jgi:polar amino acid transport system substrate-binding protein
LKNNLIHRKIKVSISSLAIFCILFFSFAILFFLSGCSKYKLGADLEGINIETNTADTIAEGIENSIDSSSSDNDTLSVEKSTLIVGSDTTYPPFEFIQNSEIVGFDIDIINEIVKRLDKQIEIISIGWDPNFKMLREGDLDLIISAVPLNEEKESIVDFSKPYFNMKYLLISLVGSEIKIKENLAGKKIGILELSEKCLDEGYLKKFEIMVYKDVMELLGALKNTEVDAVLLSLPIAVNLLKENKDMYVVMEVIQSNKDFSIVFNKGSRLKNEVDRVIDEIVSDRIYDEIYNKWFNYNI